MHIAERCTNCFIMRNNKELQKPSCTVSKCPLAAKMKILMMRFARIIILPVYLHFARHTFNIFVGQSWKMLPQRSKSRHITLLLIQRLYGFIEANTLLLLHRSVLDFTISRPVSSPNYHSRLSSLMMLLLLIGHAVGRLSKAANYAVYAIQMREDRDVRRQRLPWKYSDIAAAACFPRCG